MVCWWRSGSLNLCPIHNKGVSQWHGSYSPPSDFLHGACDSLLVAWPSQRSLLVSATDFLPAMSDSWPGLAKPCVVKLWVVACSMPPSRQPHWAPCPAFFQADGLAHHASCTDPVDCIWALGRRSCPIKVETRVLSKLIACPGSFWWLQCSNYFVWSFIWFEFKKISVPFWIKLNKEVVMGHVSDQSGVESNCDILVPGHHCSWL